MCQVRPSAQAALHWSVRFKVRFKAQFYVPAIFDGLWPIRLIGPLAQCGKLGNFRTIHVATESVDLHKIDRHESKRIGVAKLAIEAIKQRDCEDFTFFRRIR